MVDERRGMFLPGILVTTVVATMFIGAAISLSPSGFMRLQQDEDQNDAEQAARAGVEYALARLHANPEWRGDGLDLRPGREDQELTVREDHGNVVGLIKTAAKTSQFRIRFNLQNGTPAGDFDDSQDPSADMSIDFAGVSFNNILGSGDQTVPGDGSVRQGRIVPSNTVYLAVEGRSGRGLSSLTTTNLNGTPAWGGVRTKVVQCGYGISSLGPPLIDAVTMAGGVVSAIFPAPIGDAVIDAERHITLGTDARGSQVLRTKKDVHFTDGNDPNLIAAGKGTLRVSESALKTGLSSAGVDLEKEEGEEFHRLTWDQVPVPDSATSGKLKAGTYVFGIDGQLHYYDMSPKDYPAYIDSHSTDEGMLIDISHPLDGSGGGVKASFSDGKATVTFSKDTEVEATTTTADLGIIPRRGAATGPSDDTYNAGLSSFISSLMVSSGSSSFHMAVNSGSAGTTNGGCSGGGVGSTNGGCSGGGVGDTNGGCSGGGVGSTNGGCSGGGSGDGGPSIDPTVALMRAFATQGASPSPDTFGHYSLTLPSGPASVDLTSSSVQLNNVVSKQQLVSSLTDYVAQHPTEPAVAQFMAANSSSLQSIEAPRGDAATDNLNPENIVVKFESKRPGKNTLLFNNGSFVFGAQVDGKNSAIVSGGEVKVVGAGVDLLSDTVKPNGLTIYAKGDVTLSTFNPANDTGAEKFNKISLKGVVYTWGNFKAILGSNEMGANQWGTLDLKGALVAYGGDPSLDPGLNGNGEVEIKARNANLTLDSSYLINLIKSPDKDKLKFGRLWWSDK
jgi:hypothetical protein